MTLDTTRQDRADRIHAPATAACGAPAETRTTQPRSLRFRVGLALLILYPFFYLAIPIAPFLPFGGRTNAAIAGGVVAVGEVVLLVAIALMGKEGYHAVKGAVKRRFSRREGR